MHGLHKFHIEDIELLSMHNISAASGRLPIAYGVFSSVRTMHVDAWQSHRMQDVVCPNSNSADNGKCNTGRHKIPDPTMGNKSFTVLHAPGPNHP